jgi:hypothetical protein
MALNANALTSLNTAKNFLKIPLAETGTDSMIEIFINSASEDCERYCDRKFKQASYVETHLGKGGNLLILNQWPIISITELRIDTAADFTSSDSLIDSDDYMVGDSYNTLYLKNGKVFPNTRGFISIRVSYDAGFSPVPSSLEHACLWLVSYYYKMWNNSNIGRPNKSKENESATYLQGWPDHVIKILNQFKRTEIPNIEAAMWNT